MTVWDCFTFNGEQEALRARLAVTGVDRHVLVESLLTHSGLPKPRLFYAGGEARVTPVLADLSRHATPWARENAQRDAVLQGLAGAAPHDVVLISDADEVPSADGIRRAVEALRTDEAVVLCQRMYNYSRRWEDPRGWRGTVATTYAHLASTTPQALRDAREELPRVPDAGEHLSWFGGTAEHQRKLRSYAHTEHAGLADRPELLAARAGGGVDPVGRWGLGFNPEAQADAVSGGIG